MLPSSVSIECGVISSTSPSPTSHGVNPNNRATMEEVWKDITINSLPNAPIIPHNHHNHSHSHSHSHHPTPSSNFRGFILQDFLGGSGSGRDPPIRAVDCSIYGSPVPRLSGLGTGASTTFDDAMNSSSVLNSFMDGFGKKRSPENDDNPSVDRRYKRMIKNRESAARSRARKQAYITELELEVAHLAEENAKLRKKQQQLMEAPPAQLPKRHGLRRTSTAPF